MQTITQPAITHSIESAGVDWITATAQKGSTRWEMSRFADSQHHRFMDAGVPIKNGYRLGYFGWSAEGFFHGQREGGTIIIASGAIAHAVHRSVANVADHISRLDVQVTVSTPIEKPNLAKQAFEIIRSGSPAKVRIKNVTYIETSPQGDTCNMGKRSSDSYGRIYDKATESGQGAARSRWRYEIELKRNPANTASTTLCSSESPEAVASQLVRGWFSARGVEPVFPPDQPFCPQKPMWSEPNRDVLSWFERSLSITVNRAVSRYGLDRVMEALRLQTHVDANYERRTADAQRCRRAVPDERDVQLLRSDNADVILD